MKHGNFDIGTIGKGKKIHYFDSADITLCRKRGARGDREGNCITCNHVLLSRAVTSETKPLRYLREI